MWIKDWAPQASQDRQLFIGNIHESMDDDISGGNICYTSGRTWLNLGFGTKKYVHSHVKEEVSPTSC